MRPAGAPTTVDDELGIVVETIEGGCGGVLREEHSYPAGSRAEVNPSGQLTVLDAQNQVVVQFAGGNWVNWRRGGSAGPAKYGSC